MTLGGRQRSEKGRGLQLVRGSEARCDFCGRPATTVAVIAGRSPRATVICPSCVHRAALQLPGPGGGGDAA